MARSPPRDIAGPLFYNAPLLLDETGEFSPPMLDAVRQPSSREGVVRVRPARSRLTFSARFLLLVGVMNACPWGAHPARAVAAMRPATAGPAPAKIGCVYAVRAPGERPGSARAGLLEVVGEGLDHGDEPGPGGHQRSEHAFLDRPLRAHRADTGGDYPAVERLAKLGVQPDPPASTKRLWTAGAMTNVTAANSCAQAA